MDAIFWHLTNESLSSKENAACSNLATKRAGQRAITPPISSGLAKNRSNQYHWLMKTNLEQFDHPTLSQRQLWVMLLAVALLLILLTAIFLQERSKEWRLRVEQSNYRLTLAEEIVSRDLNRVRADLRFVAGLPGLIQADPNDPNTLQNAADIFADFVRHQQAYSQVRLIGRDGVEVARVDWDGDQTKVTQANKLQDKSDRYYVSESLHLNPAEIFISEFDLNLENGKIETPLKPVIRFVTPVQRIDSDENASAPSGNAPAGNLLVFNYQGSSLLSELAGISLPGNTYLIRDDGQFLLGPTPDVQWGWLLDHGQQFSTRFKDIPLEQLLSSDRPLRSNDGLFLARQIDISRKGATSADHRPLFVVAHIPQSAAYSATQKMLYRLLLVGGIMLVPLALITRFWAAAIDRREMQNQKIADSEKRLRQLSAQLVGLQEEERRNISREIHDSLGQQATAINLDLRMLRDSISDSPELERLITESDGLLKALHGFATRVRPAELDDLGLKIALESHVAEFETRTGTECDFDAQFADDEINPSIATHVFRMVQELLNNVAKHASAEVASVALKLDRERNEFEVCVNDYGVGMSTAKEIPVSSTRLGMIGLRERVELLNGTLDVQSSPEGTRVEIRIPVSPDPINEESE